MDIEKILYHLRRNRLEGKALKIVLSGCLFLVIAFVILIAIAIILAFNYQAQISDGFMRIINFIFGDSPDNVIRGFFKQLGDNFIKDLFK